MISGGELRRFLSESLEVVSESGGPKGYIGDMGKQSYAVKIDGVDPAFLGKSMGQQTDDLAKIKAFKETAKKTHVDAKGKSSLAAVKAWVKMRQPDQYYAAWQTDSDNYKDDSVEVWFKADALESVEEAAPTWLKQGEVDRLIATLEDAEQRFKEHLDYIKKSDARSSGGALKWTESVLGDLRSLISLIADGE